MSLGERRALKSVTVRKDVMAIDVMWSDDIVRDDGTVIASTPHARAYSSELRAQFIEDLSPYADAVVYARLAWGE